MEFIKFRAWDNKNKKFAIKEFNIIGETTVFDLANKYQLENLVKLEISQFTGLKDKNGIEIYEGDLLQSKTKYAIMNFKVMRKKGGLVINSHSNDFKRNENEIIFTDAVADMQTVSFIENSCVLIGNIFENEDLLL